LVHVVAPGENLYRIALRYRMSVEGLARLNNLWDPGYIRAGQRLQIQTCYAVRSYGWWVWERASYVPPANPAPISDSGIYIVQQGDNLFRIAVKFNTSVKDLVTANGLVNESVSVGQRLFVP
jgi:LysM repeat protein